MNRLNGKWIFLILVTFLWVGCKAKTDNVYKVEEPTPPVPEASFQPNEAQLKSVPKSTPVSLPSVPKAPEVPTSNVALKDYTSETINRKTTGQEVVIENIQPQLDVLFVIDDSKSMLAHQEKLSESIDLFVKAFSKTQFIDYHVGVVSIYDSKRYFKPLGISEQEERYQHGVTEWSRLRPNERNFERLGRLTPLVGQDLTDSQIDNRYYTKEMNINVLGQTLKVGAKSFIKQDQWNPQGQLVQEAFGPRYEEIFSPLVAALDLSYLVSSSNINSEFFRQQFPKSDEQDEMNWDPNQHDWQELTQAYNQGFLRPSAHLAVIIITDTIDQSPNLSAQSVADFLTQIKNDPDYKKISTYGALYPDSLSKSMRSLKGYTRDSMVNCQKEEDIQLGGYDQSTPIEEFLNLTRGAKPKGSNIFNICDSSYATVLGQMGAEIGQKRLTEMEVLLNSIPEQGTIVVKVGSMIIPPLSGSVTGAQTPGWKTQFQQGQKKLILYHLDKIKNLEQNAKISITYNEVDPLTATTENTIKVGE